MIKITHCRGTLALNYNTYSSIGLSRLFNGRKGSSVLPFASPASDPAMEDEFDKNRQVMSISGVQEKFSLILTGNKLRLLQEGQQGSYILKPIPSIGGKVSQMPANEHLTMQIASQVYHIETAENALIFFSDGQPAYVTKRFDVGKGGHKLAQEDFGSLAGRTPQSHGSDYKYQGNYLQLFELMQQFIPAYRIEAPKLLKRLMFNYLFSNGDAHFKNFSLLETARGDFRLSPAYDLLNSHIHIKDRDFALLDGLLPKNISRGKIQHQFALLSEMAGISRGVFESMLTAMISGNEQVGNLTFASFLDDHTKRNYWQSYQAKLKQITKI